jgi:hypothetical protein
MFFKKKVMPIIDEDDKIINTLLLYMYDDGKYHSLNMEEYLKEWDHKDIQRLKMKMIGNDLIKEEAKTSSFQYDDLVGGLQPIYDFELTDKASDLIKHYGDYLKYRVEQVKIENKKIKREERQQKRQDMEQLLKIYSGAVAVFVSLATLIGASITSYSTISNINATNKELKEVKNTVDSLRKEIQKQKKY